MSQTRGKLGLDSELECHSCTGHVTIVARFQITQQGTSPPAAPADTELSLGTTRGGPVERAIAMREKRHCLRSRDDHWPGRRRRGRLPPLHALTTPGATAPPLRGSSSGRLRGSVALAANESGIGAPPLDDEVIGWGAYARQHDVGNVDSEPI